MTIPEIMVAFRKAEKTGHIIDLHNYAECIDDCYTCPACKACNYLTNTRGFNLSSNIYGGFKHEFDKLITKEILEDPKYSSENIQNNFPEYYI